MTETELIDGELPKPVFLGYLAKRSAPVVDGDWAGATEVCSASGCIAKHHPDWFGDMFVSPVLNRAGCVHSAEAARERLPEVDRPSYRIYAFRAIPVIFGKEDVAPQILAKET